MAACACHEWTDIVESPREEPPPVLLTEAWAGQRMGWCYCPLPAGEKAPPPSGWTTAPRSTEDDLPVWVEQQGRNLALRCGEPSGGLIVVDVDAYKGGVLPEGDWPATPVVDTPGGGQHHYYKVRGDVAIKNSAGALARSVDIKTTHGYVVAVGSRHPNGGVYSWRPGHSPDDVPVADLPPWVLARLTRPEPAPHQPAAHPGPARMDPYIAKALADEAERVRTAPEGQRNSTLNTAAHALGTLASQGMDREVAQAELVAAAQVAGLGEHEALATFSSGWAAGTAKPRHAPQDRPMPGERTVQAPAAYAATMPDQVQEPGPAAVQARFQVVDSARWHETEPPPMRWLFEGMIPSGVLAGLTAMGGSGKSWLALEISMSLAAGVTILPSFAPMGPAPVLAILGEDGEDEVHRRYRRVLRAFPTLADRADLIAENLHLVCGVAAPLAGHDAARDVRGTQAYAALQELVDDYEPSLLVIDPKAQFFGLDESSNDETVQWYGLLRRLRTDMTTLVTQHVSKAKENSMDSGASRGASANRDDCRAMLNLGVISKEIATAIAAKGECVNDFIAIDLVKSNYSARLRAPVLLRRILDSPGCPEHETMGGVMMEVAVPKVAGETEAMHLVAATIGTNPENLGKNQIAREDSAIRSALLVQGIRVKDIGRLIDAAVAAKLLYYDPVPGAGKPKQVPRRTES